MVQKAELSLLQGWKLRLAILSAIVLPSVSATGAYYKLQLQLTEKNQKTEDRVSKLELDASRNFADKATMEDLRKDVGNMKQDITSIKTLLERKLR